MKLYMHVYGVICICVCVLYTVTHTCTIYVRTVCTCTHYSHLITVCLCPSGPIIGLASGFGLLSVITTVMSIIFLFFCVMSFKKKKNVKSAYMCTLLTTFKYLILCFDLLTESNNVDSDNDIPMTTNPSYMRTTLSTPQPPPTHVI